MILKNMQVSDLRDWYELWYKPNNATLVVVGDVDPQQIFSMAEKYYGGIPKREVTPSKARLEPTQVGERRVEVKAVAKLPYMIMGYKVPTLKTIEDSQEAYALHVLAGILDGGRSSRLSKNLVREQEVAASAGAGYSLYSARNGMFLFDGTPNASTTLAELEQAIKLEIDKLKNELVSERELSRVKAQVVASEIYQQDSVQRQAYIIGSLETVGLGWETMNNYSEKVKAVTAQQIQDVAKKYLIDEHITVAYLTPIEVQGAGEAK